jgi:hypothetical protein
MADSRVNEAARPNPMLEPLRILVGSWNTMGNHPLVPGKTFHGRTTFSWIEGGAFLVMRSQIDEPEIPSGIAIIGTDDGSGEYAMLYFDERGVSRRYATRIESNEWRWWRNDASFSQRFVGTISLTARRSSATANSRGTAGTGNPILPSPILASSERVRRRIPRDRAARP